MSAEVSLGHNACMAEVSIYVAVISAVAGIGGATISQLITAFREGSQAKRDRQERHAEAMRQACVELLRAAGDLRAQVANNYSYHGLEMGARLEQVRRYAAATQLYAVSVSLLAPEILGESADLLATAAGSLADWAVGNTNLEQGSMIREPNFRQLDDCVRAFRTKVVGDAES
jgi:hypothetical protein